MAITAAMVKELRELTGAGMMDCKKALGETNGDMDAAVEVLKAGGAQISGGEDGGGLVDPDGGGDLGVVLAQLGSQGQDQILDALQSLPGIFKACQIRSRHGVAQIVKITGFQHGYTSFCGRGPQIL